MDEKLLSLAFSVEANKGVYALLLGSGISYAAGIPTGRGVLRELCRRMMQVSGDNEEDPMGWYEKKYGKTPLYNEVIEILAKTSSERNGLLKEFFEPTPEEIKEKQKIPTDAHHALAKLVQKGYVKVIVTTNFDRLLEHALDELSIQYQTVYHQTDIEGMKPLAHAQCTILKINGDYRDTRFKNVTDELDHYSESLESMIHRVFDEYGVIVSGWSAEWDTALRDIIKSVKGRRYSWYWHAFTENLTPHAEELIKFRDACKIVDTRGADHFFTDLHENVANISKVKRISPEHIQIKMKRLKRYITDDQEIDLREMVTEHTKEVVSFLMQQQYDGHITPESMIEKIETVKEQSRALSMLLAVLSYYMKREEQEALLMQTLERLTGSRKHRGQPHLLSLQQMPLQAALYSVGIAAVMKKNYHLLNLLFTRPKVHDPYSHHLSFLKYTSPSLGLGRLFHYVSSDKAYHLPMETVFIYPYMKKVFIDTQLAFDEAEFERYYDIFELLRAIKYRHSGEQGYMCGRFGFNSNREHLIRFLKEGREDYSWPVLAICDGSREAFLVALEKLAKDLDDSGHGLVHAYIGNQ
ncbi:SIR2 family protein [Bacillus sp. FJAT-42315]|uniref:SIR2 family protein n=1 Tax=Bacillus sp. FJAT-42315 TaxID=2014077 RepID=UPI000C246FCE|nr:SIR2 family protein [Bacillus sp. FJAT-42315]